MSRDNLPANSRTTCAEDARRVEIDNGSDFDDCSIFATFTESASWGSGYCVSNIGCGQPG